MALTEKNLGIIAALGLALATCISSSSMGSGIFQDVKFTVFCFLALSLPWIVIGRWLNQWLGVSLALYSCLWAWNGLPLYGLTPVILPLAAIFLCRVAAGNHALTFLRGAAWINAALSFYQLCGGETFGGHDPAYLYKVQGAFGHPMLAGGFFAIIAPVAVGKWSKYEAALFIALALLSRETTAICGLIGALFFLFWRRHEILGVAAAALSAWLFIVFSSAFRSIAFFDFHGRLPVWNVAWNFIQQNPWGYGPGAWAGRFSEWGIDTSMVAQPAMWTVLHNEWLQFLFEGGIQAFLPFVIGAYLLLKRLPPWSGASMAALSVNALGAFPLHNVGLAIAAGMILMLGVSEIGGTDAVRSV